VRGWEGGEVDGEGIGKVGEMGKEEVAGGGNAWCGWREGTSNFPQKGHNTGPSPVWHSNLL